MTSGTKRSRSPRGSGELLADEILDAATELLVEHGDDASVSIRSVAAQVGVTPPSIYLHFADKDALLDAVCARYFERLDVELARVSDSVTEPLDRLIQLGMAYVRFALETPVVYRIAFRGSETGGDSKVDEVLAASAFGRLRAEVGMLASAGYVTARTVDDVVLECWASAHGIASLMLAKPALPWGPDLHIAENLLRACMLGRIVDDDPQGRFVGPALCEIRERITRTDSSGPPNPV